MNDCPSNMHADTKKCADRNGEGKGSVANRDPHHCVHPDKKCNQNQDGKVKFFKKWFVNKEFYELGFTFVIAISAVVSATVAHFQWQAMNKQLDEMRDNSIQADKMLKSTEKLAKSAVDTLNLSREQFNQTNRPYIIPVVQPSRGLVGEAVQAKLTLINYGKTVALNTVVWGKVFIGPNALQDATNWFEPFKVQNPVNGIPVPPGIPNEMNKERLARFLSDRNMSIADARLAAEHDGVVAIVARIQYQSTTGTIHHTDVCYSLNKSWEATLCPTNNTVD